MTRFDFRKTELDGACIIENFHIGDSRGGFSKIFEKDIFAKAGINFDINEVFYSVSAKNVIRGLHFQTHNPQAKLVTVVKGKVWDVIVDMRSESKTYKRWISVELSDKNHKAVYVPRRFAHGFVSLEEQSIMLYQCDGEYDKESDSGIIYNDKDISISWPIDNRQAIHSARDMLLMSSSEFTGFTGKV